MMALDQLLTDSSPYLARARLYSFTAKVSNTPMPIKLNAPHTQLTESRITTRNTTATKIKVPTSFSMRIRSDEYAIGSACKRFITLWPYT